MTDLFTRKVDGQDQEHWGVYRKGNAVQEAAARAIAPHTAKQHRQVLLALRSAPAGLTAEELVEATGIIRTSICARVRELELRGRVEKRGHTTARTGRTVNVYRAAKTPPEGVTDGKA